MNWRKGLIYVGLALGALLVVRIVVSLVFGLLGFLWTALTTLATVLAVGILLYGGYKILSRVRGNEMASVSDSVGEWESISTKPANRVERLKERYANGELSEAEFERRLSQELDDHQTESLDRELREHE